MLTRYFAILTLSLPLCACQTPEEIAAADDARCRNYGAKPGSDAYISCRVSQQKIRSDEDIAMAAGSTTCTMVGGLDGQPRREVTRWF